jgi:hypothetical protein
MACCILTKEAVKSAFACRRSSLIDGGCIGLTSVTFGLAIGVDPLNPAHPTNVVARQQSKNLFIQFSVVVFFQYQRA